MYCSKKVTCRLIITRRNGSELLELTEEVFDQTACFIQLAIIMSLLIPITLRRNDRFFAGGQQGRDNPIIGVVGFVSKKLVGFYSGQKLVRSIKVMSLPRRQMKSDWITQSINDCVYLCAQSTFAAPDGLAVTVFFWAPALC